MNVPNLLALLLLSLNCAAQFGLTNVPKASLPPSIRYVGQLKRAVRWTDGAGDNLLILTTTGPTTRKSTEEDAHDAALAARHYLIQNGAGRQTWQVQDYVNECPFDLTLQFIDKAFAVTDLNKNGHAEVWLLYKTACRGDVSPARLKLVMYEADRKYAARGETKTKISATGYTGGRYTFDDAFRRAPASFRQYADQLWHQHSLETWE